MWMRRVALIIFYDDQKRILLQDRTGISKIGEEWAFFDGEIEANETPEQALVRETKEELDLELGSYEYIGRFKNVINESLGVDRHAFISPIGDHIQKIRQIEGKSMRFFTLDDAMGLRMIPGDEAVIEKLRELLNSKTI